MSEQRDAPRTRWHFEGYDLEPGNFTTAMVHLYRAEVTRTNLWRSRLDTTTNWAVVTTGAAFSISFSSPDTPHFVLLLVLMLVLTFLFIEARRYAYYALWYHRVRLMETDFFAPMVAGPFEPREGWSAELHHTLMEPTFLLPPWHAIAIRYRRNFIWIVTIILVAWGLKLGIHPTTATSLDMMIARAGINGWLPGIWVVGFVTLLYAALLGVVVAMYIVRSREDEETGRPSPYRGPLEVHARAGEQLAIIVTNRRAEVSQAVMERINRGVTALSGTGMYTGEARDVLFCALKETQVSKLRKAVLGVDPRAFVVLTGAHDVRGRGFAPAAASAAEPPS